MSDIRPPYLRQPPSAPAARRPLSEQEFAEARGIIDDASDRSYFLPFQVSPGGEIAPAVPGLALDLLDAAKLPGDVYQGRVDPLGEEDMRRGFGLAGMVSGGPAFRMGARTGRGSARVMSGEGDDIYDPPRFPQRGFRDDYPGEVPADAAGKLQADIEGRPLGARYIAGRTHAQLPDQRLGPDDVAGVGQGILGGPPRRVPEGTIAGLGATEVDAADRPLGILLRDDLAPDVAARVHGHEVGHVIDQIAGMIPIDGLERELARNYDRLATGNRWTTGRLTGPAEIGYSEGMQPREYMVEAIRAYLADPNYMKTELPETAARIRAYVNEHPELRNTIQFNNLGPMIAGGGLGATALSGGGAPSPVPAPDAWDLAPLDRRVEHSPSQPLPFDMRLTAPGEPALASASLTPRNGLARLLAFGRPSASG